MTELSIHNARVVAISQPEAWTGCQDAGELLAYCARVSNTAGQGNHHTGWKLIRSLIRRKEWSPLDMVTMTVEISTTRDISRQILRHWSFRFQEFSYRYAALEQPLVLRDARDQHPTDRQASTPTANDGVADWWLRTQVAMRRHVEETYNAALAMGIAKEVARTILPEGMTPTRLYVQGTVRSWWHYCELRCAPGTQLEHQAVAHSVLVRLFERFPSLRQVWMDQNGIAP